MGEPSKHNGDIASLFCRSPLVSNGAVVAVVVVLMVEFCGMMDFRFESTGELGVEEQRATVWNLRCSK